MKFLKDIQCQIHTIFGGGKDMGSVASTRKSVFTDIQTKTRYNKRFWIKNAGVKVFNEYGWKEKKTKFR